MVLESVFYGVRVYFFRFFFFSDSELVVLLVVLLELYEVQLWVRRCFFYVYVVSFKFSLIGKNMVDDRELSLSIQIQVEGFLVLGVGGEEVKLQGFFFLYLDFFKWLVFLEKCLRLVLVYMLQDCVVVRFVLGLFLDKVFTQLFQ